MITFRFFGHEWLAERWDHNVRLRDASLWQWGARRIEGGFPGWAVHFGPLHFMVCRLPKNAVLAKVG